MPAIKVHHTETSESSWDGPANEARLKNDGSESYYRKAYAWQDPEGDPETKSAYKFINHEVDGSGNIGPANVKACQTGIAVLNGARGGTKIPEADRQGVYNHLAAHLKDADVEPPELREKPSGIETRFLPAEMRVASDGAIEGYAAVFGVWSEVLGWFRERIRAGAFAKTAKEADVRALFNHDSNYVLGRTRSGTLELKEDKKGLFFRVLPPDTQWAADLRTSIGREDIDQASFQFDAIREDWDWNVDPVERELIEAKLYDVSVVTFPAYPQTSVQARSAAEQLLSRVRDNPDVAKYVSDQLSQLIAPAAPGVGPHPAGPDDEDKARVLRQRDFRRMRLKIF
jgi:HK97 family phage prohead protease